MTSTRAFLERWRERSHWLVGAWVVVTLYTAVQAYLYPAVVGGGHWWRALVTNAVVYAPWMLVIPLVDAILEAHPIERRNWLRRLLVHAVLGLAVTLILFVPAQLLLRALGIHGNYPLSSLLVWGVQSMYPTYWLIVLALAALHSYRQFQEARVQAMALRASLSEARLEALSAQLEPHFLFNALNSVSSLMLEDPRAAQSMLARLGELLRATLRTDRNQRISLADEVEVLRMYLDIERVRHEDRIEVRLDVPPECEETRVPPFLLQPLVENAFRHGLGGREQGGRVWVRAARQGTSLRIEVGDDGEGADSSALQEGVGLSNTRSRLQQLYGAEASLAIESAPQRGFSAVITLPCRAKVA